MERYPNPDMDDVAGVLDRRAEAVIIDGLLVAISFGAVGYLAGAVVLGGQFGGFGGLIVALQFGAPVGLLAYQAGFEGHYGQTVGKRLRGIVVVKEDGSPMTWGASVLRNVLRLVDALPAFYVVGVVVAYLTGTQQRIGDYAASTMVVHTQE
ncbi:RDD family protein [Halobacteriaceae archaeon GCM10025711]